MERGEYQIARAGKVDWSGARYVRWPKVAIAATRPTRSPSGDNLPCPCSRLVQACHLRRSEWKPRLKTTLSSLFRALHRPIFSRYEIQLSSGRVHHCGSAGHGFKTPLGPIGKCNPCVRYEMEPMSRVAQGRILGQTKTAGSAPPDRDFSVW